MRGYPPGFAGPVTGPGTTTARKRPQRRPGIYRTWERAAVYLGRAVLISVVATLAVLLVAERACGQEPLIEVRVSSVGTELVRGRLTPGGDLELPAEPLEGLTGEGFEREWLTLAELRDALPSQVSIAYRPEKALLVIRDPYAALQATRDRRERQRDAGRARPAGAFGGPWAVVTADSRQEAGVRAGWELGRFSFSAGTSTVGRASWGASVRVLSRTWISYNDAEGQPPAFQVRSSPDLLGSTLATARWSPGGEVDARLSTALGPVTLLATTEKTAAVGLRGDGISWTVGRTADGIYTTRFALGARAFSTLSIPRVR